MEMEAPPLSTVQASSMLSHVFVSSQNESTFKASQINLARSISVSTDFVLLFDWRSNNE